MGLAFHAPFTRKAVTIEKEGLPLAEPVTMQTQSPRERKRMAAHSEVMAVTMFDALWPRLKRQAARLCMAGGML